MGLVNLTVTHSIGAYGSRDLREFDLGQQYDDDVNFSTGAGHLDLPQIHDNQCASWWTFQTPLPAAATGTYV